MISSVEAQGDDLRVMRQRQSACFTLNRLGDPIGRFGRFNLAPGRYVTSDSYVYRYGSAIARSKGCERVRGGAEILVRYEIPLEEN